MRRIEHRRYERIIGDRKVYEMTPEELYDPITKEVGEMCRHRLEKRWYRRLCALNFLIVVFFVTIFLVNLDDNKDFFRRYYEQEKSKFALEESDDYESLLGMFGDEEITQDDIPVEVTMVFYGASILIVGYISLYVYYAINRAMSLRITERNFPEVYQTIEEYAYKLGIPVPKAYVMQSNGILNAFSSFLLRRQWIMINSELFEVAYREHQDKDSLNFIIAHEMAHIYYGHATLRYNLLIWFTMNIPILGTTASRAREYSCDRLAQRLTGVSGIDAMLVLVVDRHLYKMVDKEDYINEMRQIRGFFTWAANLFMDHPIMSKRILALVEGRGSGKLY